MIVRPATQADLAALARIQKGAFDIYVERMGKPPAPMLVNLSAHLEVDTVFVAEAAGRVSGYLVCDESQVPPLLDTVAVAPDAQGRGLGRALFRYLENSLRRKGFDRYQLYTNVKMVENLALYPRLGFVRTKQVTENGYERVYFEKRL